MLKLSDAQYDRLAQSRRGQFLERLEASLRRTLPLEAHTMPASFTRPALDRMAEAIVYAASPFGHFTPEIRKTADQIGFISRFEFKRDATLSAGMQEFSGPAPQ